MNIETIYDWLLLFTISMGLVGTTVFILLLVSRKDKPPTFTAEYLKWRRHMENMHGISVDYSHDMQRSQEGANRLQEIAGGLEESSKAQHAHTMLQSTREAVSRIRGEGFVAGKDDQPITMNPYGPGTGPAKQWARGWCQGKNIMDPKPYMEAS